MKALASGALAFDTETTGTDPSQARIVTAHAVEVNALGKGDERGWLLDPGIEIPAEAAAIHKITTEVARADGVQPLVAVPEIRDYLMRTWARGAPVIAMNASYDLTVIACELERYSLPPFTLGPVLDPLVLDRALDKYRKGSRKLPDLAKHYGVKLGDSHTADGDALTAARVVWKMLHRPELADMSLEGLQKFQRDSHRAWAVNYQSYLRTRGGKPDAVIEQSWPMRGVHA